MLSTRCGPFSVKVLYSRLVRPGDRARSAGSRPTFLVDGVSPQGTVRCVDRHWRAELVVAADGSAFRCSSVAGPRAPRSHARPSGAIRLLVARTGHQADDTVLGNSGRVGCASASFHAHPLKFSFTLSLRWMMTTGNPIPLDIEYWAVHFPKLASEGLFERAGGAEGVHRPPSLPIREGPILDKGARSVEMLLMRFHQPAKVRGCHSSTPCCCRITCRLVPTCPMRWLRGSAIGVGSLSNQTQTWSRRYDWITAEWPRSAYPLRDSIIWAIGKSRWFNSYMRVADRVDAPHHRVLPWLSSSFEARARSEFKMRS